MDLPRQEDYFRGIWLKVGKSLVSGRGWDILPPEKGKSGELSKETVVVETDFIHYHIAMCCVV